MSADNLPVPVIFACPYTSIAIRSTHRITRDFDCKVCAKSRNRNVFSNPADAKLFRLVLPKANGAGAVCRKILSLGAKLSVRAGEKQVFANELVECSNVCVQLSSADSRLELGYLRIGLSEKDRLHCFEIIVRHCGSFEEIVVERLPDAWKQPCANALSICGISWQLIDEHSLLDNDAQCKECYWYNCQECSSK